MSVESVDSCLRESAVLAVVLDSDSRLERESFRQSRRGSGGENAAVNDIDKGWCHLPRCAVPGGAHYDSVKRERFLFEAEIHFVGLSGLDVE